MAAVEVGSGVTYYPPREARTLRVTLDLERRIRKIQVGWACPPFHVSFRSTAKPFARAQAAGRVHVPERPFIRWETVMDERMSRCHAPDSVWEDTVFAVRTNLSEEERSRPSEPRETRRTISSCTPEQAQPKMLSKPPRRTR